MMVHRSATAMYRRKALLLLQCSRGIRGVCRIPWEMYEWMEIPQTLHGNPPLFAAVAAIAASSSSGQLFPDVVVAVSGTCHTHNLATRPNNSSVDKAALSLKQLLRLGKHRENIQISLSRSLRAFDVNAVAI